MSKYGEKQIKFFTKKDYFGGVTLDERVRGEIHAAIKKHEHKYSEGLADRMVGYIMDQIVSLSTPQWSNFGKYKQEGTSPLPVSCYILNVNNSISRN